MGSVEIFYCAHIEPYDWKAGQGYYWVAGLPGCLWDGTPEGPFETYEEALNAACHDADELIS